MTDACQNPARPRGLARLRKPIHGLVPRPRPLAGAARRQVQRILVLVKGENPTFNYYLESRLAVANDVPFTVHSIETGQLPSVDVRGLFVIICRYVDRRHLRWLEQHRESLAGVAYFIDDDVASLVTGTDGTLAYRLYVGYFSVLPMRRLSRLLGAVWVSTPALAAALAPFGDPPEVLSPRPVLSDNLPAPDRRDEETLRIAFHATDVHAGEHRFLRDVVPEVLDRHPNVRFEVLARGANKQLWESSGIEPARMEILPLMSWPDYRRQSRTRGVDILLVPLLASGLNACRADTKRIDACRMGAACVFSAGEVYGGRRHPEECLVENDRQDWVRAIAGMISDKARRKEAVAATRSRVFEMAASPVGRFFEELASQRETEI